MQEFACHQLGKTFVSQNGTISALENVGFAVAKQEFVSIVGPSGCGKTTLLKIIAGLMPPTTGEITFGTRTENDRPQNAMVFQEHGLFPWMTVLENVGFGLEMYGVQKQKRHERARGFIEQVGLTDFIHSYPHQLSVGMRQRTSIARAFVTDPQILLMDEPFSSLDAQTKLILQDELLRIWRDHKKTVVYITHDIEEAIVLSDRVLVMTGRPGSIREEILIPLPRPRDPIHADYQKVRDLKRHVWSMLEDEVRQSMRCSLLLKSP
jgi:NitT/TauT family transport system ATP-binding protein